MAILSVKDVWRCVWMVSGVQCVMIPGALQMLRLCATNLDIQYQVSQKQN